MKTFVILKTDAIDLKLVGKILTRFEDAGLDIVRIGTRYKSIFWRRKHYSHLPDSIFESVVPTVEGKLIGIVLEGYDAVSRVKNMVGCTHPEQAQPGTIRFDFCHYPAPRNLIHASDADKVDDEIAIFFDPMTG